ncbi:tetratricopeptide repeat protein [Aulosira sp. FACHB-615]|uniref:tetratricopeptide repeat protein n=1 Tax=Aulosira sp. FACHB-615 TaxID=2692777 RepID=UPI001682E7FB|nr:tetratricopeptide repeat protein [Aulosira sp. FACHB-615]MBD2491350.1 tetratricopeptide repeat protein [Aulosira sp. FACHB-615]
MKSVIPSGRSVLEQINIDIGSLKNIKPSSKRSHYRAVNNWLEKYQPKANASNLEQVQGYLEAFHHLCEIVEWQKAEIVLSVSINTITGTSYTLYRQLEIWGYYSQQIEIYKRLAENENVPSTLSVIALVGLGNVYARLANYTEAISYSQKAREQSHASNNLQGKSNALNNLGIAYAGMGKFKQAFGYFEDSLKIATDAKLLPEQARALGDMGNTYGNLRQFYKAINSLEQCRAIACQLGDRVLESQALGNLGNAYGYLKNYAKASEYFEKYLTTSRELENPSGEAIALNCLGELYRRTKQYAQGISCFEQSLSIARETRELFSEGVALGNLGSTYGGMGNYQQAIEYHRQALAITRRIGDRQGIFLAQINLTLTHLVLKFFRIWHRHNCN